MGKQTLLLYATRLLLVYVKKIFRVLATATRQILPSDIIFIPEIRPLPSRFFFRHLPLILAQIMESDSTIEKPKGYGHPTHNCFVVALRTCCQYLPPTRLSPFEIKRLDR